MRLGETDHVVIVGGGLAGARTAEALRGQGFTGRLTLAGAEPHRPYDRPPLSKDVLWGQTDATTLKTDWDALGCELRLGQRANALRLSDDRGGSLLLDSGDELAFDALVIATGSVPIRLPGEGAQRVLRTIDDALALRAALQEGARIVIAGAGWIGAEVATAAARAGCQVTVVEAADTPLATAIGPEVGGETTSWYAAEGIELRLGVKVASVSDGGLALAGGDWIDADEIVTGIGVRPDVAWLDGSGLKIDGGVVVDEMLRTDRPEIVAAGDCAAWWSRRFGRRLRVEHWDTGLNSPEAAAAGLLGGDTVYDPVPYFWSEQFGRMVQYAGHHPAGDRLVWRGDPAAEKWAACWLAGERLVAILTVSRPRDLAQGRRVIASGAAVDEARLADPDVPVRETVRD